MHIAGGKQAENRAKTPGVTLMCKQEQGWRGLQAGDRDTQVLGSFSCSILEQRFVNRRKPPGKCWLIYHKSLPSTPQPPPYLPESGRLCLQRMQNGAGVHGVQLVVFACLAYVKPCIEPPAPHRSDEMAHACNLSTGRGRQEDRRLKITPSPPDI